MYKGKNIKTQKTRMVNGVKVKTVETEISSFYNSLSVEAGTTGYMGGGAGKGGRTFIKILNINDTDIEVQRDADGQGFTVKLGGDTELDTFIEALEFVISTLKEERNKINKQKYIKKMPNTKINNEATSKQLKFLKILLEKNKYQLSTTNISKIQADELIKIFNEENDGVIVIPSEYEKYLNRIS